jgi:hypothetical protein
MSMLWDVILLEEVEQWYFSLDADAMAEVTGPSTCWSWRDPPWGARRLTR